MKRIIKYEHEALRLNEQFKRKHLDALIRLKTAHGINYFDVIPNGVKFAQYVGVIQIDGLCIEILPKADKSEENTKWQHVLTEMLQICGRIKIKASSDAGLKRSKLNLLEIYFEQFLSEIQLLIHTGLIKKYRKQSGNVSALKGKLEFALHIRHNSVHRERFYTTHQIYDKNHIIHQVISQALEIVGQFSSSMQLNDLCKRVQLDFPEVKQIRATKQLLDSIQINRKTAPYERALELARLIILNYSPDISQGKEKMISILFNMNQLWEEYVLIRLKQAAKRNPEIQVLGKRSKPFWNSNRLEPDIVIEKNGEKYIIDTKWKTPGTSTSVQDLRQMYAYGRFWNAHKIMLLYPGEQDNNGFSVFHNVEYLKSEYADEYRAQQHACMKGFVSVIHPETNRLDDKLGEKILDIFQLL